MSPVSLEILSTVEQLYEKSHLTRLAVWENDLEGHSSNSAKTRTPLKLAGVPQTPEPLSAISGPKFAISWRHVGEILLFNSFFPLSICALVAKISPDKVVRWCPDGEFWRLFGSGIFSEPRAAHLRPVF